MRNHMDTARANRMGIRRLRRATILAAGFAAVALGVEGRALAQPEPPHFEATVLERVEPRNGFRDDGYTIWSMADDGTVYGSVYDQRGHTKAIKSKVGEGTTWLLPRDPGQIELRPIAASTSGVVLLFAFSWPQNYIYVPGHGGRQLNNLHADLFFPYDMNNEHTLVGQVGVDPNYRAVAYRLQSGFEYLHEATSDCRKINQIGSIVGTTGFTSDDLFFRVWHSDGRVSDFTVPRLRAWVGVSDITNPDEVAGKHFRLDQSGRARLAGWFWSERTGMVEIPFRYEEPEGGFDVQIYGISDDGWVFGNEHFRSSEGDDYFLWHVDSGFFDLGDLYDWQGRFAYPAGGNNGAVNGPGQLVVPTFGLASGRGVYVLLNRIK